MKQSSLSFSLTDIFKYLIGCCIVCAFCANPAFAQLQLVPLPAETVTEESRNLRTEVVALPFFDDFSTSRNTSPDSKYWLPQSGVYVNNSLSTTHPSRNMATFDGLNAAGVPYNVDNPLGQGFTDTLTSQPINLAGKTASDSVYLSFYWMAKGLGELPDSSDYLRLEFLNTDNVWSTAWTQNGYEVNTNFNRVFIKITSAAFFHGAFQFRFMSYGRNSGPYDTWHLDYVYLNSNRSVRQPYIFDVATRKAISPFFKKYTAIPLRQYLVAPAAAISDSAQTDIVNHFNNFNILTNTFTLTDAATGKEYQRTVQRSIYVESLKSRALSVKLTAPAISAAVDSISLVSKFFITTTDSIPNLSLKNNDTIVSNVVLSNYFAYDDGSAEYGVQVNQRLGEVAVRYVLSKPDTIGGVKIAVVPFNRNIAGQSFTIRFFANDNGKPGRLLGQRAVAASYGSRRDSFVDYKLAAPVAVPDTFFVGWMQINEQPLTVGFDRNSLMGKNQIFYNLGTEWVREVNLNGSIMIRPTLADRAAEVVTGVEPVDQADLFFPNPGDGIVNWKVNNLKRIDIYAPNGKLMDSLAPYNGQKSWDLRKLRGGMYILNAFDGKRSYSQKVLIVR